MYLTLFISVNPRVGGDVVSCGSCGEEFSLSSLSSFIQHKSLPCSPTNHNNKFKTNPRKYVENPRTSPDSAGADNDSRVESSSQSSRKTATDAATNTVNTGTHTSSKINLKELILCRICLHFYPLYLCNPMPADWIFQTMNSVRPNNQSSKYQRFTPKG